MADHKKPYVSLDDAIQALLREIVDHAENGHTSGAKDLAVAYRLLRGGAQPGSAIVESK